VATGDATRVEADDVEPAQDLRAQSGVGRGDEPHAGNARTTRMDHERADARGGVRRQVFGDRQRDGGSVGMAPVDRYLDRGAPQDGIAGGGRAGLPVDGGGRMLRGTGRGRCCHAQQDGAGDADRRHGGFSHGWCPVSEESDEEPK